VVRHLEHAADVARLALVEKEIRLGGVAVDAALALQKAERNERIEEVASRPLV
jgi:hypothetical protein